MPRTSLHADNYKTINMRNSILGLLFTPFTYTLKNQYQYV